MKKKTLIFSLVFVLLIALGILLNSGINSEKKKIAEEKFTEKLLALMPNQEPDKLEELEVKPSTAETKIVRKFKAYSEEKLVGYIYIGETKGYKAGLQIAYAINSKTHKVTGATIISHNETAKFIEALENSNFYNQFKNVDLNIFNIKLKRVYLADTTSKATPNGENKDPNAVIAPATTTGFENLLLFIRTEYAKDNKYFVMPSGLTLLSRDVDYTNINQFKYVFKSDDKEVQVVVDKDYNIVTISDESERQTIVDLLKDEDNHMPYWIESENSVGSITTLVIRAKAYQTTYAIGTVKIDNGSVTDVKIEYTAPQTYADDHNTDYMGGDYNNAPQQIKDNVDIPVITGATRTYEGLHAIQKIVRGYLEAKYE